MSIHDAMRDACAAVGIKPPRRTVPGKWVQCPVDGKAATNGSGRVLVFDDGRGGLAWNWSTGQQQRFSAEGLGANETRAPKRDPEAEARAMAELHEIARACERIVRACTPGPHPYLVAKGFPDEHGLVIEDVRPCLPSGHLGERIARAMPEGDGPLLIVPGRVGRQITTVQFITPEGVKKNILGGVMGGAAHRIATGRETWVAEGIATALSVRAALRLLGRSATVLSAFSAQNVARVAGGLRGAIIAADHDKPIEQFGGLGTGEYWSRKSGCRWVMPPARGDWNDMHQAEGLRAVAVLLREIRPP
jgi:putative DNA primase/helicase